MGSSRTCEWREDLERKSRDRSVVLVDCFDTTVHRDCSPQTVIDRWLDNVAEIYGLEIGVLRGAWALSAGHRKYLYDREEETFREVCGDLYHRMRQAGGLTVPFESFYETVLERMYRIERSVLRADAEMAQFIRRAREEGKKVCCVSDFYLPAETVESLTAGLGIEMDRYYVSSDVGLRKSSGRLYEYVLRDLGIGPEEAVMAGDNSRSDCAVPERLGIAAVRVEAEKAQEEGLCGYLAALSKENEARNVPFADLSFSLYLFLRRLHRQLEQRNTQTVWFFSREGEFLKKAFDRYLEMEQAQGIRTEYLYVSRQATYLPSLESIDREQFQVLKKQYNSLSLELFLKSLNLLEIVREQTALAEKYDLGAVQADFFRSEAFGAFCAEEQFRQIYERQRQTARVQARAYLAGMGIREGGSIAIVDIGWKGSIQDNLYGILGKNCHITGYYYGLTGDVQLDEGSEKIGLVFSDVPCQSRYFDVYSISHRMLERMLYASHGSCVTYAEQGPVLAEADRKEKELYAFVRPTQERMLELFGKIHGYAVDKLIAEQELSREIVKRHMAYCLNITKQRMEQTRYTDGRLVANFGDWGCNKDLLRTMYLQLRQLRRMSGVQRLNRLFLVLAKFRLWPVIRCLRSLFLPGFIKKAANDR